MLKIYNSSESKEAIEKVLNRNREIPSGVVDTVREIIDRMRTEKDTALFAYTEKYDGWKPDDVSIKVTEKELQDAVNSIEPGLKKALNKAADNIYAFHKKQAQTGYMQEQDGIVLGQKIRPLGSVGVYVPGGTASYPSTVLMNVLPAKVAGVERICMVTPALNGKMNPLTLAAASVCGIKEIYKIGGAQAIATLAYGTKLIKRVDKIVGPGNIYVAAAKKEVYGAVGIDMIAGPSEVMVIADKSANPRFVAADMLSQAEHDTNASAILITDSMELARQVDKELESQCPLLKRREIARASLEQYGLIIVAKDLHEAVAYANAAAPEHLELAVENPEKLLGSVENAGAVFLGHYSPEPLGDYYAGPNHVLPTAGTARFSSPLGVYDFVKRTSIIKYNKEQLRNAAGDIAALAAAEGLNAHARTVTIRFESEE
ncbi:MAG: histidinol dehydrogenase [Christensenellales bacterium]